MMLTMIVLVLVTLAAITVLAWWLLDFELPEVAIPVAAPGLGAGLIYFYGTALAWAAGLILLAIGGFVAYRLIVNRSEDTRKPRD